MSTAPRLSGREALVRQVRRLTETMVAADISDAAAERAAVVVARLREELPASAPRLTPWYWDLPQEARDGSTGWLRHNPVAPPVRLEVSGQGLVGNVRFGTPFVGPPGRVHGGYLAAVLDHVLGSYLSSIGRASLTLSLTTTYPGPAPLDVDLEVAAGHAAMDGRKTVAWAEIRHEGVVVSRAEGLFLTIAPSAPALPAAHDEGMVR